MLNVALVLTTFAGWFWRMLSFDFQKVDYGYAACSEQPH